MRLTGKDKDLMKVKILARRQQLTDTTVPLIII